MATKAKMVYVDEATWTQLKADAKSAGKLLSAYIDELLKNSVRARTN